MAPHRIEVQRIYEENKSPGYRVLVDRLWPRGIRKDEADFDEWCKDVAPSTELRRWYGHAPERFDAFVRRYRDELKRPPASDALAHLRDVARRRRLVLLTATRDVDRSAAHVLQQSLRRR